ncbi:MAG: hypothetical protein ABIH66_14355 [bacterium]
MKLAKAIPLTLSDSPKPVVTDYELGLLIVKIFFSKKVKGESVDIRRKDFPDRRFVNKKIKEFCNGEIIFPQFDLPRGRAYRVMGKKQDDPGEIACSVDPFAYVSHLSAMVFHGITDRVPRIFFVSSPGPRQWSEFAAEKTKKDCKGFYADYIAGGLPRLVKIRFNRISGIPVNTYTSIHRGAFKSVQGRALRVSTIGRTFLDMVRKPKFCGGIRHVVEVFEDHGPRYSKLIIDEVERHGKPIEKVRTGYLLDEVCKINDERIDGWLKYVQRGGTRKLDPGAEYSNRYSEKWCLSKNID